MTSDPVKILAEAGKDGRNRTKMIPDRPQRKDHMIIDGGAGNMQSLRDLVMF